MGLRRCAAALAQNAPGNHFEAMRAALSNSMPRGVRPPTPSLSRLDSLLTFLSLAVLEYRGGSSFYVARDTLRVHADGLRIYVSVRR